MTQTSIVGKTPEISAPVRLEGQGNSEVLFNWLTVKHHLWMLQSPHDQELERIVGSRVRLHLGFRLISWKREPSHDEHHEALVVPAEERSRTEAFAKLKKLMKAHFFGSEKESDE
jgi:hypothetical protein